MRFIISSTLEKKYYIINNYKVVNSTDDKYKATYYNTLSEADDILNTLLRTGFKEYIHIEQLKELKFVIGNLEFDEFMCINGDNAHVTNNRKDITKFDSRLTALHIIQKYTEIGYHTDHLSIIKATDVF